MENLKYYLKIVDVKPERFKYDIPFVKASDKKFIYNLKEVNFIYKKDTKLWYNEEKINIVGGAKTIDVC